MRDSTVYAFMLSIDGLGSSYVILEGPGETLLPMFRLHEFDVLGLRCLIGLVYPFAQLHCHINVS